MEPDGSIGRIPRPPASHRHLLDQRRHLDSPALHPPYSPALQSASCARQGGCRCATLGDRIGQQWQVTEQPVPTTPGSSSRFQLQVRLPLAQPRQLPRYPGNWSPLWSGLPPQSQRTQYRTTTNLREVCRGRDMSNSVLLGRLEEGQHRRVVTEYGST